MNTEGERIALEKTHVERDSAHLEVRNFFHPFSLESSAFMNLLLLLLLRVSGVLSKLVPNL